MANIITRRSFMQAGAQAALGLGLASLTQLPPFLKRALAESNIGGYFLGFIALAMVASFALIVSRRDILQQEPSRVLLI